MTRWQLAKQIRYKLSLRKWEANASYSVVFGNSVFVSVADITALLSYPSTPIAQVRIGEQTADPERGEHQGLIRFGIAVRIINMVAGDAVGENVLLGANRSGATTTGQGSSAGRGLSEIEEEVLAAIKDMRMQDGIRLKYLFTSGIAAVHVGEATHLAYQDIVFEATGTADRDYEPPTNFRATNGVGSIALAWTNPPDRYDLYKIIIRRAVGSTPPATVSDGTGITLAADTITALVNRDALTSSKSDVVAAGTYSYSFFVQYDETKNLGDAPTSAERTSVAATISGAVSS